MINYLPILVMVLLSLVFVLAAIGLSLIIGPKKYNRTKSDMYECGIDPTPLPQQGGRFPVKYYITAMLFIVFDIEVVFLYPWAVSFGYLGWFGLVEMLLFILTAFTAYIFVWRRGGLDWE